MTTVSAEVVDAPALTPGTGPPGGRVAVIDYDGRKGWFVRLIRHYTLREDLVREMQEAGCEVTEEHHFIDRQSFVIFKVR